MGIYGAGTFAALRDEGFHDFFVEFVPYGERIIDYADQHGWEGHAVKPKTVVDAGRAAAQKLEHAANNSTSATQVWFDKKTKEKVQDPSLQVQDGAEKLNATGELNAPGESLNATPQTDSTEAEQTAITNIVQNLKNKSVVLSEDVAELVTKADDAVRKDGVLPSKPMPSSQSEDIPARDIAVTSDQPTYPKQLPIGFEAPPGFVTPVSVEPAAAKVAPSIPLPLEAPAVLSFLSFEPVLAQLASTIDYLTAFLNDNPSAGTNSNAKDVLDKAQTDLVQLGERFQRVKDEEKNKLEDMLEEQARDYSVKLLQLEIEAQDKLDLQEEDWRSYFDQERQAVVQAYRAKLEAELKAQSEIINER